MQRIPLNVRIAGMLSLAWPIVLSRSSQAVTGFCDAMMIAPAGEVAMAATTTASLNVLCLATLPIGVVFIVQSYASQMAGKGQQYQSRRFAIYGLAFALAAGVVAMLGIPAVASTMTWLGYSGEMQRLMSGYTSIRLSSMVAMVGLEAIGNWYAGTDRPDRHMQASLLTMISNICLNWLLIEGHWGVPAFGVVGAAWASAVAAWLGFLYIGFGFVRHARTQRPTTQDTPTRSLNASFWNWAEARGMLAFGLPNGLNWFMQLAAYAVFLNFVVAQLGTLALAAVLVVFNINTVSFMPAFGLATAGSIMAGQAIGKDEVHKVPQVLSLTLLLTCSWQGLVGLAYWAGAETIVSIFVPTGDTPQEFIQLSTALLSISVAWQLFDACAMSYSETLRAAGDTAYCMWCRLATAWFVFVPTSVFVVHKNGGGVHSALWCLVGYLALLALATALRFHTGRWRKIRLLSNSS